MTLHATGNHFIVVPDRPAVTSRGLALPHSAQRPACSGTLLSAGPAALRRFPGLSAGQRVAFRPYSGRTLEWEGRELRLLEWHEMIGLLEAGVDAPAVSE